MKIHPVIFSWIFLLIYTPVNAQSDSTTIRPPPVIKVNYRTLSTVPDKAYFISYLTDSRDIVISPYRWNKYQWMAASGVVLTAGALFTVDGRIQKFVQRNQTPALSNISLYGFAPFGSGLYSLPALGILYGVGAITKNDKARYTALKGGEAFVLGFITEQFLKQLTHRHRPYQDNPSNPYLWMGLFTPSVTHPLHPDTLPAHLLWPHVLPVHTVRPFGFLSFVIPLPDLRHFHAFITMTTGFRM